MAFYLITGVSASGKSTIRKELQTIGYDAHDTDEDDITAWYNKSTKQQVNRPDNPNDRTQKWLKDHDWMMSATQVEELAKTALNKTVFLCGVTSNQFDFYNLFAKVFCLEIDQDTLKQRLANRTTNDFGKTPDELASVLSWHKWFEQESKNKGAIMIDANKSVPDIVAQIQANIK